MNLLRTVFPLRLPAPSLTVKVPSSVALPKESTT
jgi:hypothetical protein